MKVSVVIPAGGAGLRMGGDVPKQFLELGGAPILKRTLAIFDALEFVREIAVAVPENYFDEVREYETAKPLRTVIGSGTRAESVFAALNALSADTEIVLIHDGIRPFVTREIIEAVAKAASTHGAAVACAPVTDTIKQAARGIITATLDRSVLWQAQTPQGFTYEIIQKAYSAAATDGVLSHATDDSALVERLGIPVKIVPSCASNIKITTQADLNAARALV